MATKVFGDWGEQLAATDLQRRGWEIVAQKFRAGRKEVDLVARRGGVVAFVEVKTRASTTFGHPLEAIDARKMRDVAWVAMNWIDRFGAASDNYRFDAVAVTRSPGGSPVVEHLEDAWRM